MRIIREHSGSVVKCLTCDQGAAGSSLTGGTHLVVSLSKTHLSLLSTGSTQEDPSQHDWKIVDWDVKNQIKQTKNMTRSIIMKQNFVYIGLFPASGKFCCMLLILGRSGPTKGRAWSGSKLFDTLIVILKEFWKKKNNFEKYQQTRKKDETYPSMRC